ncbi:MAG: translocation/assembly module TamB domain-containing protein [Clostridium sp.]|nr:translocation/assembly module TamB domain-containing protein [Clostridium sp.]
MNSAVRNAYRVIRSVVFTAILSAVALYVILYVLLSIPSVQNSIRSEAESQLSELLGGKLSIGRLEVFPYNEIVLYDVSLDDPNGERCVYIGKVGSGISLWQLIVNHKIEITYAELISPDIRLWQERQGGPLNIQFLIDAFKPKQKNKPPTKFDLKIHNVVIRGGCFSFSKLWVPELRNPMKIDFNHIQLTDINADIELPRLRNDDFSVDVRRLAFEVPQLLSVEKIGCVAHITPNSISVANLIVKLPGTDIHPVDFSLSFSDFKHIADALKSGNHSLLLLDNTVSPYDFRGFLPSLSNFRGKYDLNLEVVGNLNSLNVKNFKLTDSDNDFTLFLSGNLESLLIPKALQTNIRSLRLIANSRFVDKVMSAFPAIPQRAREVALAAGDINLDLKGTANPGAGRFDANGFVKLSVGIVKLDASAMRLARNGWHIDGDVDIDNLNAGSLLDFPDLGRLSLSANADIDIYGNDFSGSARVEIPQVSYKNRLITDISASVEKSGDRIIAQGGVNDDSFMLDFSGEALIQGPSSHYVLSAVLNNVRPADFFYHPSIAGYSFSGDINADIYGSNIDNIHGSFSLTDFRAVGDPNGDFEIRNLNVSSVVDEDYRTFDIHSDFFEANVEGQFLPSRIPLLMKGLVSQAIPTLVSAPSSDWHSDMKGSYRLVVFRDNDLIDILNLPVHLLSDIEISGEFNGNPGLFSLKTDIPYLLQGKDKLVRDLSLDVSLNDSDHTASIIAGVMYPTKKGDLRLDLDVSACDDRFMVNTDFNRDRDVSFYGSLSLDGLLQRNIADNSLQGSLHIRPSSFFLNKAEWKLRESDITYRDKILRISDFNLQHADQFVDISGVAGASEDDLLNIGLANIDLQYIFDTLNINYVNFGGLATGDLYASAVFSKAPEARTKKLFVKDLSYNGALLGDGDLSSHWDNNQKCVTIDALISEGKRKTVDMKGGIWVTRDSLSFDFNTDKVNVAFLKPFMSAFADEFEGRASGHALLYGTFSDIDLCGDVFADTISIKLGFTNVAYSGSDSVRITPGRITIPEFTLYDKYGNTARLSGELTHRYFHQPSFDFRITDIDKMLCYDTNSRLNPDWYGTIFASGSANIVGRPGIVRIGANATTAEKSNFTFVLNDRLDADEYHFLTFTDKRREEAEKMALQNEPEYMKYLRNRKTQVDGPPTIFEMDLRVDVTPTATMAIVMDPKGGDRITAHGSGSLNLGYSSEDNDMYMYGRYTLDEGTYNFTLQDLILKDFIIRPGSSISFNGDPLDAMLNISAAYRVNTSLTDLDKSFATDKELNRTNVPVDAVLNVTGDMTSPNVTFDIDLPTLTEETARKVRSIISTEDMMSRQIIYLLALNRFYTPGYMDTSSHGGEWASVASSTLSSQLSNMLGQLTDKVSVMPSLRSDRGDFSDVEVDVALSSRLLNNRLIINGNFGYRDHNTSSTTFVGDFDIEYLLNASGNLRLKAYNHFNDQNYYLRQALTTQGIGIVYRREFDNPFTFLRRRPKIPEQQHDSIR